MSEEQFQNNEAAEEGAPAWVVTFADLMSLLLCFFVLLLSFSEMDRQKYREVAGSMANAFGVQRKEKVYESPKGTKIVARAFDREKLATRDKEEIGKEREKKEKKEETAKKMEAEIESKALELKDMIEIEPGKHQNGYPVDGGVRLRFRRSSCKAGNAAALEKDCIYPERNIRGDRHRRSYRQYTCFRGEIQIQPAIIHRARSKSHRTPTGPGTDCARKNLGGRFW